MSAWSKRSRLVARWFDIDAASVRGANRLARRAVGPAITLAPGRIVLLAGPSGAGKSTLLARLCRKYSRSLDWIDLDWVHLADERVIDIMAAAQAAADRGARAQESSARQPRDRRVDEPIADESAPDEPVVAALEALSRVGLGEVWTYLRRPAQLSAGQRWRLRLAVALARARRVAESGRVCVLAADEFAAGLDRVSAAIVCRLLRRVIIAAPPLAAIVATAREDLASWLRADQIIQCDFGEVASDGAASS